MNQTLFYIVRHGETEWNSIGKQQGHLDSSLTSRGVEQAKALVKGLVGKSIELIYTSDLGRALQTVNILNDELNLEIKTDVRLRERHLGSMQGLTKDEFKEKNESEWEKFSSGDPDYIFPGGESARQRYERTVSCVEDLADKHPGKVILVVTHGGVLNGLFYRAVGLPLSKPRRFSLFNAAINSFSIEDNVWRLDTWGDISHLNGLDTLDDN